MTVKILLVDDSSTALLLGKMLFKKYTGYEVVTALNGREAVLKAVAEKPDLIFMDVHMPRMDGFAACREIRKMESLESVPIVMVTSSGESANVELGYESGCSAYLTKPFNANELQEMVHRFLGPQASPRVLAPGFGQLPIAKY